MADLYSGSSLNPLSKHLFAVVDIDTRTGRLIYSAAVQVEPQIQALVLGKQGNGSSECGHFNGLSPLSFTQAAQCAHFHLVCVGGVGGSDGEAGALNLFRHHFYAGACDVCRGFGCDVKYAVIYGHVVDIATLFGHKFYLAGFRVDLFGVDDKGLLFREG